MVKAVMTRALPIVCVGVALFLLTPVSGIAGQTGEWRAYASDKASTKYTPLDQIDADTVHDLRIAWRQSTIPDATMVVFEESGHCLMFEEPARFTEAVDRFARAV